ncbi:MAG: ribose-phosphate pyrophosphokinase [Kiritimatiellae bacterium]|nr:ribose-phosphate pyrophosphokinase [Kiritimatiellia bacterium]
MIVFTGTANPHLAERIIAYLGGSLGGISIHRFLDGEIHVKLEESVRGKDVFIVQSICTQPNEMLMELLIMIDAAKRASAARITAVLPYFGYARQDRKDQPRVPLTAKLVANLLVTAGADRILTVDLHASQIQGFFDIPVDHLHATPVLVKYLRELKLNKPIIVSPDTGGAKTAYAYSQILGTDLAIVAKQRLGDADVDAFSVVGNVNGCDVIMIDDMTATCGTLCAAAKILREKGAVSIRAAVTHIPLTEKGIQRLKGETGLTELVMTDTIPLREDVLTAGLPTKVTVLSVAGLLGEAIRRIHENQSVSTLFRH